MDKIWKTPKSLKGYYKISEDGEVWRLRQGPGARINRPLSVRFTKYGYRMVKITVDRDTKLRTVHSLVAEAFLGERPLGLVINHRDGNHLNNHFTNLEYVTQRENVLYARKMGRCNQNFILTEEKARYIKQLMANGMKEIEVVRLLGIKRHFVNSIRMKRCWAHV